MWLDGKLHFCTGAHEQKAKNLAVTPAKILAFHKAPYSQTRYVM